MYKVKNRYNFVYIKNVVEKSFEHIKSGKLRIKTTVFQGVIDILNRVLNSFEQKWHYTKSIINLIVNSLLMTKIKFVTIHN